MIEKNNKSTLNVDTPGAIVLQWLSYAFWGWTVVAIAYLAAVITSFILDGSWTTDSAEPVSYGIAATLILIPFSVVFDWIFSKREKQEKHGVASVVMIIHSVLFALIAIGALVLVAFSLVGLLISTGDNTGSVIAIVVASVLVILYSKLTTRIVRPMLFTKFRLFFRIAVGVIAVTALAWGAVGPLTQAIVTKDDRAIRSGLSSLSYAITQYASTNDMLPSTLRAVTDNRTIMDTIYPPVQSQGLIGYIDRGLITYTPNTKPAADYSSAFDTDGSSISKKFYYELCGVFTHRLKQQPWYVSYGSPELGDDGYTTSIDDGVIEVGKRCYKLTTSYYKAL